jgi:hypothetical protein
MQPKTLVCGLPPICACLLHPCAAPLIGAHPGAFLCPTGLIYGPQGSFMVLGANLWPWGSFIAPRAHVYALKLLCAPLSIHARPPLLCMPWDSFMPPGLFNGPRGSFMAHGALLWPRGSFIAPRAPICALELLCVSPPQICMRLLHLCMALFIRARPGALLYPIGPFYGP